MEDPATPRRDDKVQNGDSARMNPSKPRRQNDRKKLSLSVTKGARSSHDGVNQIAPQHPIALPFLTVQDTSGLLYWHLGGAGRLLCYPFPGTTTSFWRSRIFYARFSGAPFLVSMTASISDLTMILFLALYSSCDPTNVDLSDVGTSKKALLIRETKETQAFQFPLAVTPLAATLRPRMRHRRNWNPDRAYILPCSAMASAGDCQFQQICHHAAEHVLSPQVIQQLNLLQAISTFAPFHNSVISIRGW